MSTCEKDLNAVSLNDKHLSLFKNFHLYSRTFTFTQERSPLLKNVHIYSKTFTGSKILVYKILQGTRPE